MLPYIFAASLKCSVEGGGHLSAQSRSALNRKHCRIQSASNADLSISGLNN